MALKIRRGTEAQRVLLTGAEIPVAGELLYVTDTKKLYIGDGTTPGGNPISLEGFQSNTIALNYGITGNATVNAQFGVDRGNNLDVFIRWNESLDRWEFTNDGTNYDAIGSFAGKTTDILPEGNTNLYYTNGRANAAFALNSINSLRDVDTTSASAGQSLIWDPQSGNWIPGTPPVPTNLTLTGAYSARRYSFTANTGQTDYTLGLEPTSVNNLIVIVNGQFLAPSQYSLSGLVLTLVSAPTAGQTVAVIDLTSGTTLGAINRTVNSFLSSQGQTIYPVPGGYEIGRVDVFVNGVLLSDNEFVANTGSHITFLDSLDQNDEVKIIKYSTFNSNYLNYVIRKELFVANANQSTFTVNGGYRPGFTDVYINGIKQISGEDYVANDAQNVVLYEAADAGDYIEIASWITNSEFISANGDVNFGGNINQGTATNRASEYLVWNATTNATPTELFLNGVADRRIPITANSTMNVEVFVTARRTDVRGEGAAYKFNCAFEDINGNVNTLGSVLETIIGEDDATWSANVVAQSNTLRVVVTGTTTKLISWTALVKTVETIY